MANRDRILMSLLQWFRSVQVFVCALTHLDHTHTRTHTLIFCPLTLVFSHSHALISIISNFWDGRQQLIARKCEGQEMTEKSKREEATERQKERNRLRERKEGRVERREGREGRRKERREGGKAQGWAGDPWQHTHCCLGSRKI